MAAILMKCGSSFSRPILAGEQRLREFERHARAGQHLVRIVAVGALGIDDGQRARQRRGWFVVIGDDEVDTQLASALRSFRRANPTIHRDDDHGPRRVEPFDRGGLQAVPILQSVGDEMSHHPPKQLDRPAQNHRRRHPIDIVVTVNHDRLTTSDGLAQARDRHPHVFQTIRIVELVEAGPKKPGSLLRIAQTALTEEPRDHGRDVEGRRQRSDLPGVDRRILPDPAHHQCACSGPGPCPAPALSSTKDCPRRPMFRNLSYRASSRARESRADTAARWRESASSTSAAAARWSRWAPPVGSATISSIDPERQQVRRRDLERLGRFDLALRIPPQNGRAAFRRNDAVDAELLHQHAIADGNAERAAAPPSPQTSTMMGVSRRAISRRLRAIASATPRSSDSIPG